MTRTEKKREPVRQSVHVDCPIEDAFRLFTEKFAEWWPIESHSISGKGAESCEIEPWVGGKVLERTRSGKELDWGDVKTWDPPRRVEFTWHPGTDRREDQTVSVEFQVETDGTRVTLIHTGWDAARAIHCFANFAANQMAVFA